MMRRSDERQAPLHPRQLAPKRAYRLDTEAGQNREKELSMSSMAELIDVFFNGRKAKPRVSATEKSKYTWPDCEPLDKSDPHWEFNNNANCNGIPYFRKEVSPGKWQWVIDQESLRRSNEWDQQRRDLYWALQTRVLTDDEMAQVKNYGSRLNIEPCLSG